MSRGGTSESALESDGSARFGTTFCGFGVKLGLGGLKDSRIDVGGIGF